MLAFEAGRGPHHGLLVERKGVVIDGTPAKGRADGRAQDAVAVGLGGGVPTGVEVMRDLLHLQHPDAGGQETVERAQEVLRRDARAGLAVRHLAERVHARVGAPGAVEANLLAGDLLQGVHQRALDGGNVGLDLPAVELAAVVGEG